MKLHKFQFLFLKVCQRNTSWYLPSYARKEVLLNYRAKSRLVRFAVPTGSKHHSNLNTPSMESESSSSIFNVSQSQSNESFRIGLESTETDVLVGGHLQASRAVFSLSQLRYSPSTSAGSIYPYLTLYQEQSDWHEHSATEPVTVHTLFLGPYPHSLYIKVQAAVWQKCALSSVSSAHTSLQLQNNGMVIAVQGE